MLRKFKFLDYGASYAYAPPQEDCIINTDEVVSAIPTDARGSGPFMMVRFNGGYNLTLVGQPEDLL